MSARLSAYERARLRNIARNNATLRSLGLAENPMLGNARAAPATNKKRKRKPKAMDRIEQGQRPIPGKENTTMATKAAEELPFRSLCALY